MTAPPDPTIAVLATYNERENILALTEQLLGLPLTLSVLVVDDHSPDGTAEALRKHYGDDDRIILVEREKKLGYGTAMVTGFRLALDRGFETVVTLQCLFRVLSVQLSLLGPGTRTGCGF